MTLTTVALTFMFSWLSGVTPLFGTQSGQAQTQKIRKEDSLNHWKKWLQEDVVYLISEEEEDVFNKLTSDEEREQFVEQFWRRRDPNPLTAENEFRTEHYRRVQYANDRFTAGIPGWKTDRGMIYIKFGEPHRIESHIGGGAYERPEHEGGGRTTTYPFEIWNYRYLEGMGTDVEIEFVDLSGAGLYKISVDPWEKDFFLRVPGMGNTWAEDETTDDETFAELRAARISGKRIYGDGRGQGIMFERSKYTPFARGELVAKLTAPAPIKFTDLKSLVSARVTYNHIPFDVQNHYLRMTDDYVLAPVALEFPNSVLSFESEYGLHLSRLQVYGIVTDLTGRIIYEFDDEIVNQYSDEHFEEEKSGVARYYRSLALQPGRYKLQLVVKDKVADRMGSLDVALFPPRYPTTDLSASSVIVASELGGAPPERAFRDPYVFGNFRVRPRFDRNIRQGEYLSVYFEIYNFAVDVTTNEPSVDVQYTLVDPRQAGPEPKYVNISKGTIFDTDHLSVPLFIDVSGQKPGRHEIVFLIHDQVSGKDLKVKEEFQVLPAKEPVSPQPQP